MLCSLAPVEVDYTKLAGHVRACDRSRKYTVPYTGPCWYARRGLMNALSSTIYLVRVLGCTWQELDIDDACSYLARLRRVTS